VSTDDATDLMPDKTIYITIGNSDDKLTQREWARFCDEVFVLLSDTAQEVHGQWFSATDSPYQNACFCVVIETYDEEDLRAELRDLGIKFRQESIMWTEASVTEFLK
jgi:vacuolar-type H+-ATPase subunit B/Vma2